MQCYNNSWTFVFIQLLVYKFKINKITILIMNFYVITYLLAGLVVAIFALAIALIMIADKRFKPRKVR